MLLDTKAILASGYGMQKEHITALINAAKKTGCVIGIRPVSEAGRQYIKAGYPTKSFFVKNKSAKLGVAAGLLVKDPIFGRSTKDEYGKHHKFLEEALQKDSTLTFTPLILTQENIAELKNIQKDNLNILAVGKVKENYPAEYRITWQKSGEVITVTAVKDENNQYHIFDRYKKPLEVLGQKIMTPSGEVVKPITVDYDLLVVAPKYESVDFHRLDKTPFRTQGQLKSSSTKNIAALDASLKPDYQGPMESKTGGNWSQRTEFVVNVINHEITNLDDKRNEATKMVHHNAEFHNPFADELKNNVPCLLVFPDKMNLSAISLSPLAKSVGSVLIETPEEMALIRNHLKNQGFYWPAHAKYNETLKPFADNAVNAAKEGVMKANTRKFHFFQERNGSISQESVKAKQEKSPDNVGGKAAPEPSQDSPPAKRTHRPRS